MSRLIGVNTLVFQEELNEGTKKQWEYFKKMSELEVPFVEVRREYIRDFTSELYLTREKAKVENLILYYSVPDTLFVQGKVNEQLDTYFREANELNAKRLKLTLGDFISFTNSEVETLKSLLDYYPEIKLSIENDQSKEGGSAELLSLVTIEAHQHGIPLSITFDTGNFTYIGEVPEQAAKVLNDFVEYIHIKNIKILSDGQLLPTLFDEGDLDLAVVLDAFRFNIVAAIEYSCGPKEQAFDVLKNQLQIIRVQ